MQLKSTSSHSQYQESQDAITYTLKIKNYDDLRRRATTPIILAVMVLSDKSEEWLTWTEKDLLIKGRMYWTSLKNAPEKDNAYSVAIKLDRSQMVNSSELLKLLKRIAEEEWYDL